jgi:hypothetical protein
VTDVLPDRSASSAAEGLTAHPGIEIVCRDRCGLYAEAARHGAPKARQVADRFHLLQNLREAIEKQLSNIGRPIRATASDNLATPGISSGHQEVRDQQQIARTARRAAQLAVFAQLRAMFAAGSTAADIVRKLGLSRKRVDKWVRLQALHGTCADGTKGVFASLLPEPSRPQVGGGLHPRTAAIRRAQRPWLFGLLFLPGAVLVALAANSRQVQHERVRRHSSAVSHGYRPGWPRDLPARRRGALHEAAAAPDTATGGER